MHIIAADVGGTKTRLAIADAAEPRNVLYETRYLSSDFDSFEPMLQSFIEETGMVDTRSNTSAVDILSLALPGLVSDSSAHLTNLPWVIEKQALKNTFGIKNVYFMNDFQASAFGTGQLLEKDRIVLNPGHVDTDALKKNSTRVAVGAGTGLGLAWAEAVPVNGHPAEHPTNNSKVAHTLINTHDTEGGHIDFAPTDETQIRLLQFLQKRHGHVSYERILSGNGLVSLYHFCSGKEEQGIDAEWVNRHSKTDEAADSALSLFVKIYGAYIGNIALLFKPYGGIYITGGIAAKILHKMQSEEFITAYLNKGRMQALVEQIAVYLVTNERVGVLGAMSEAIKLQQATE